MIKFFKRLIYGECWGPFAGGCPYKNPAEIRNRCKQCYGHGLSVLDSILEEVKEVTRPTVH